mmetsp:Transcript_48566/g.94936  ORF Transcript_48566/g.94936 Transcript_48566/m.94936 type:complete len:209 (+) Transcript_48566:743-1369(+)
MQRLPLAGRTSQIWLVLQCAEAPVVSSGRHWQCALIAQPVALLGFQHDPERHCSWSVQRSPSSIVASRRQYLGLSSPSDAQWKLACVQPPQRENEHSALHSHLPLFAPALMKHFFVRHHLSSLHRAPTSRFLNVISVGREVGVLVMVGDRVVRCVGLPVGLGTKLAHWLGIMGWITTQLWPAGQPPHPSLLQTGQWHRPSWELPLAPR